MKKLLSILTFICLFVGATYAQQGTIRGEVFDENGLLPGVDIMVVETNQALSTDSDGAFDLKLPAGNYNIAFYFPGYTKEIATIGLAAESTANVEIKMTLAEAVAEEPKKKKFFLWRWFSKKN